MANAVSRIPFSASTQGQGIKIAATSTPGTLVHTTGVSLTVQDEIRLYFYNAHTADVLVTVEFGGATAPDQNIVLTVPFKSGLVQCIPASDLMLTGSGSVALTVKVFAGTTNVIIAYGCVFRTTP
jgi:hypothetical protein